jgi:penicillin-binding protein 1A
MTSDTDHQPPADDLAPPKRRRWLTWLLGFLAVIILLAAGVAVAMVLVLVNYGKSLPDYQQLAAYEPPVITRIHAGDGSLLEEFARERRLFVPIDVIPKPVIEAFLSAEDKSFYTHGGVDYLGVMRAVVTNVKNKMTGRRPVGASTITQQVAKNFLLSNEVSYERKIKEAILAYRIERAFTKDQILELYLNEIYLGFGSYGVAAAALNYFNKSLEEVTYGEAAYLAALPKAPNNYHPVRQYAAAVARRNWVLSRMAEDGHITREVRDREQAAPLVVRPPRRGDVFQAHYFTEEVRRFIAPMARRLCMKRACRCAPRWSRACKPLPSAC